MLRGYGAWLGVACVAVMWLGCEVKVTRRSPDDDRWNRTSPDAGSWSDPAAPDAADASAGGPGDDHGDAAVTDAAVADAAVEPTELPSHCSLSFEIGDCLAAHLAYWHDPELRTCVSMIYSGCGGNDNRFETREACIASCPPPASNADCESPRVQTSICIGCGPLGGCGEEAVACALPCGSHGDCVDEAGLVCVDSFCQVGGCI